MRLLDVSRLFYRQTYLKTVPHKLSIKGESQSEIRNCLVYFTPVSCKVVIVNYSVSTFVIGDLYYYSVS